MHDSQVLNDQLLDLFANALGRDVPSVDTDLFETGVLDSLAFVELLLHLERQFGTTVTVDDLEVDHFRSIARIAGFISARQDEMRLKVVPLTSRGARA